MTSTFTEHTLPNGLRVICETMPRVRSAAVGFLVRTGSRHEARQQHGVSHFLEHMCFKGTANRSCNEINVRFDELGSIYNAFTGKEHTVYYGWVPVESLSDQLELLADMMRPALPPADFETERNVILEEIAMSADNFDHHVWNFLHESLFGEHPLAHEILGDKASIASLPLDVMVDYHARRYAPDNILLLGAGAIEPEALFAGVGRYCGEWPRNGASAPPPRPDVPPLPHGVRKKKVEQFKQQFVALVYPSLPQTTEMNESIEAFTTLFGGPNSRCYWNIVQKGICTSAGAAWLSYEDCGYIVLYADGEPERCDEMLKALRAQAREVMRGGFTTAEVQRVKNQRRTQLAREAENPRTRLMQLVDDIESHGRVLTADARLAAVEEVSQKTISEYLRRYPIDGKGLLVSVGPRDWPD